MCRGCGLVLPTTSSQSHLYVPIIGIRFLRCRRVFSILRKCTVRKSPICVVSFDTKIFDHNSKFYHHKAKTDFAAKIKKMANVIQKKFLRIEATDGCFEGHVFTQTIIHSEESGFHYISPPTYVESIPIPHGLPCTETDDVTSLEA